MAYPELNRYSYIRAYREVLPSLRMEKLEAQLGRAAIRLMEPKDSTYLESNNSEFGPLRGKNIEGIDIPSVEIYKANKLWFTHFEILLPPSQKNNVRLSRLNTRIANDAELKARLDHIAHDNHVDNQRLKVTTGPLIELPTSAEHKHLGSLFALRIEKPEEAVTCLTAHDEAISEAVRRTGVGNELIRDFRLSFDAGDIALPLFRIPPGIDKAQRVRFVDRAEECLPPDGIDLSLGQPEWDNRSR